MLAGGEKIDTIVFQSWRVKNVENLLDNIQFFYSRQVLGPVEVHLINWPVLNMLYALKYKWNANISISN